MSRSGYDYDIDQWQLIKWRGAVKAATRGKRGQKLLKDILAGLDALPEKRLVRNALVLDPKHDDVTPVGDLLIAPDGTACFPGEVCAMGAAAKVRGLDVSNIDPESPEDVAALFDVSDKLTREIAYENDEGGPWQGETPEQRFIRMRKWVASQIWDWVEVDA